MEISENRVCETPILLIVFKRPELTRRVLRGIAAVHPKILLIAADGPRFEEERSLCDQTRKVIEQGVDWECDIRTNYAESNLGCGTRVYTAIDWAMEQFEELIILEDDCVAEPSFFGFCEALLSKYRNDTRVMHISGDNFQQNQPTTHNGYYFSKYTHVWGWATWRRAWRYFDWHMRSWPEMRAAGLVDQWCEDSYERTYWTQLFDQMYEGAPGVWALQWTYCVWAQNGLAVLPSVNLVSNIGYGPSAAHTQAESPSMNLPTRPLTTITHPDCLLRNAQADLYTFEHHFGGAAMRGANSPGHRFLRAIRPATLPLRVARRLWRNRPKQIRSDEA